MRGILGKDPSAAEAKRSSVAQITGAPMGKSVRLTARLCKTLLAALMFGSRLYFCL